MSELKERTFLRGIALQSLYEHDLTGHDITSIIRSRFESIELDDNAKKFVIELITGVLNHKNEIDGMITKYAPEWPLDQIAVIDDHVGDAVPIHADEADLVLALHEVGGVHRGQDRDVCFFVEGMKELYGACLAASVTGNDDRPFGC